MSKRVSWNAAVLAVFGLLSVACGGGGGGSGDNQSHTLHFVSASVENGTLRTTGDTPFEVVIDNQTGKMQWSVTLEVWVVRDGRETFVYDDNVTWCGGSTAQVAPGPCTLSRAIQSINTSQFAGSSPVTLSFRLWSLSTLSYFDTIERVVDVE